MDDVEEKIFDVITNEDIAKAIADKSYTYYASHAGRLGFALFSSFVEYSFFHPRLGPNPNTAFRFFGMNLGIRYWMFGVPFRFEKRVHEVARKMGLKTITGVPVMYGSGTEEHFPGATEAMTGRRNFYMIENNGDITPMAYVNDPVVRDLYHDRETALVDMLCEKGPVLTPKQAADRLWMRH